MTQQIPEFPEFLTQQFQQFFGEGWGKAFQTLHNMDLGGNGPGLAGTAMSTPQIGFSTEKLRELQQQYLQDAGKLWSQSLHRSDQVADKRFASAAWDNNPLAALVGYSSGESEGGGGDSGSVSGDGDGDAGPPRQKRRFDSFF